MKSVHFLFDLLESLSGVFIFDTIDKNFCTDYLFRLFKHINERRNPTAIKTFIKALANYVAREDIEVSDVSDMYDVIMSEWIPEYEKMTGEVFTSHSWLLANLASKRNNIDMYVEMLKELCKYGELEVTENYAIALFNRMEYEIVGIKPNPKILTSIVNEFRLILTTKYSGKKSYWLCRSLLPLFEYYSTKKPGKAVVIAEEIKDNLIACADSDIVEFMNSDRLFMREFAHLLSELCESDDNIPEKQAYVKIFRELYRAYYDVEFVAEYQFFGILCEIRTCDSEDKQRIDNLMKELDELYNRYPDNNNINDYYADALSEVTVCIPIVEIERNLKILSSIYEKQPQDESIAYSYLSAMWNFTAECVNVDAIERYAYTALTVHAIVPNDDDITLVCLEIIDDYICCDGENSTAQEMLEIMKKTSCFNDSDSDEIMELYEEVVLKIRNIGEFE